MGLNNKSLLKGLEETVKKLSEWNNGRLIHVFTHTDLDGVVSGEMIVNVYKKLGYGVTVSNCGYNNLEETVSEFLDLGMANKYEYIYMTDLSVKDELLNERIEKEIGDKFVLLDHHETALWLNDKYEWSQVKVSYKDGRLTSGTSLVRDYLLKNGVLEQVKVGSDKLFYNTLQIAEVVRLYDTWEWAKTKDEKEGLNAKRLNDLMYMVGISKFKKRLQGLKLQGTLTKEEVAMLEGIELKYKQQYEKNKKGLFDYVMKGHDKYYNMGVVFADDFVSELGNDLAKEFSELDGIMLINGNRRQASLRTEKDDVNVAKIAEVYGGGGHQKASGFMLDLGLYVKILMAQEAHMEGKI